MDQLPLELLQHVGRFLDVGGLRSCILVSVRFYEALRDELYSFAAISDELNHQHPMHLLKAASPRNIPAFKAILSRTKNINCDKCPVPSSYPRLETAQGFSYDLDNGTASPLHILVHLYDAELVRYALASGADPQVRDCRGWSPLHLAIVLCPASDKLSVIRALLDGGADPGLMFASSGYGPRTPLLFAVECQRLSIFKMLLEAGADIRAPLSSTYHNRTISYNNLGGEYVLSCAARHSSHGADICRYILEAGNFSAETLSGVLSDAAETGDESVQLFLDAGALPGRDAMYEAVRSGNEPALRRLIDAGGNVAELDEDGRSLLWSIMDPSIGEMLLSEAPDLITVRSNEGETCLERLWENFASSDYQYHPWSGYENALFFMEKRCAVDSSFLVHAILAAARGVQTATIQLLLKYQSTLIHTVDEEKNTLLHIAASVPSSRWSYSCEDKTDVLKLLVEAGCPINAVNEYGKSALHVLLESSLNIHETEYTHPHITCLLDSGVDISIRCSKNHTALSPALENANGTLLQILVEAGILAFLEPFELAEALHQVAFNVPLDTVKRICNYEFNLNLCDDLGETVLHRVVHKALDRHWRVEGFVRMVGCIVLGYDEVSIHEVGGERRLELMRMESNGHIELIRYLCRIGVDPSIQNKKGFTPFDLVQKVGPSLPWASIKESLEERKRDPSKPLKLQWSDGVEEEWKWGEIGDLFSEG